MIEKVRTAGLEDTVQNIALLMNKHQIGCVVIVDDKKPAGIITERDMIKRVICKGISPETARVIDIMSKPLVNTSPNMLAGDAAKIMLQLNIKKLPVVEEGRLVGLVTLTDLLRSDGFIEALNARDRNTLTFESKSNLKRVKE